MVHFHSTFIELLRYTAERSAVFSILNHLPSGVDDVKGDFFALESNGQISYLPKGQKVGPWEDEYSSSRRRSGRPAATLRRVLPPEVVDLLHEADFEAAADTIKAYFKRGEGELRLCPASDIQHWYDGANYADDEVIGTLARSCMRYDECQPLMKFYEQFGDQLQLLALVNPDNQLLGRALVWTIGDRVFMDRVYGTQPTVRLFHDHAEAHGWHRRYVNSHTDAELWLAPGAGNATTIQLSVTMTEFPQDGFPYLDTFKYLNLTTGELTNVEHSEAHVYLGTTTGQPHPINGHDHGLHARGHRTWLGWAESIWNARDTVVEPTAEATVEATAEAEADDAEAAPARSRGFLEGWHWIDQLSLPPTRPTRPRPTVAIHETGQIAVNPFLTRATLPRSYINRDNSRLEEAMEDITSWYTDD